MMTRWQVLSGDRLSGKRLGGDRLNGERVNGVLRPKYILNIMVMVLSSSVYRMFVEGLE